MIVKKTNYLITFQLICIFLSCARSSEKSFKQKYEDKDGFKIIKIEESSHVRRIKESEFIKKVDYIRLETNPDCLIGEIDKISVDSKYIYILDRFVANALFVFKRNGEFVKKIGYFGRGPGEYTKIWDFKVLEDNKLIALDIYIKKAFFFDNLNYTHHKIIERLDLLNSITKNGYYYYAKPLNNNHSFDLLILDENLNVLEKEFSCDPKRTNALNFRYDFRDYRDSITFIKRFSSKIYRIKGTEIIPKYYFDFGNKQLTFEAVNNYKDYGEDLVDKFNFIRKHFYESESYILFGIIYNGLSNLALYDKNKDVLKFSQSVSHNFDKGFLIYYINSNDKYILGKIDAKYILKDKDKEIKRKLGLLGVNENDNPIITISYFK